MNPQLILLAGQLLLKYGPMVAEQFVALFHKGDPTPEDWAQLFGQVKTYESYFPAPPPPDPVPVGTLPVTS